MKIAILSDIHSNIDALKKVLQDCEKHDVKHFLILGDIIGYYYFPDDVFSILSKYSYSIVRGNHEKLLVDAYNGKIDINILVEKYGIAYRELFEKCDKNFISKLSKMPEKLTYEINNIRFLLCHGSPQYNDEYIYPDTLEEKLKTVVSKEYDFILMGHTHYPMCYSSNNCTLINPGSVGQSREVGGMASWVLFDTTNKVFRFMNSKYDTSNLIKIIEEKKDKTYLKKVLERGM